MKEIRRPIVLVDGPLRFQYMVSSYEDDTVLYENNFRLLDKKDIEYGTDQDIVDGDYIFSKVTDPLVRSTNLWTKVQFSGFKDTYTDGDGVEHELHLPTRIHRRMLRVDVPDFSPSTYSNVGYVIDISTRIGMSKVVLACRSFIPGDLLSLEEPYRDGQHRYHQYIDVEILDPWDLCYSDEYAEFRQAICKEIPDTNNCGALIDVSISAVDKDGVEYIPDIRYSSGRNMLMLSDKDSDYMCLTLDNDPDGWLAKIEFNEAYDGDFIGYLRETYFIDNVERVIPEFVIMDKDHIYKITDLEFDGSTEFLFSSSEEDLRFTDWSEYIEGMYAMAVIRIIGYNGEEIMDIKSNTVPVDKRKFSFIVGKEITLLEDMDITVNNLDIVNKIQKNIVSVDRPDDYKSNIIRPVFYKSFPLEEIEVHDSVTFTISIDLDSYKTKSDSFSIQIEGRNFSEIGRVPGGVLFKINGSELPHESENGKYYILDTNQELVAEGNYRYV